MQWRIGDVTVTRVVEMVVPVPVVQMLPEATPDGLERHRHWLHPHFVDGDGAILISVHALVVESGGRRIVVDTCVGNDKPRPFPGWSDLHTGFLDTLHTAGFPPSSIDTVLCTHLHFDHVGWNTTLQDDRWVPTFPNARYLFGRRELEHWQGAEGPEALSATTSLADSVQPVIDAGLADLVESDARLTDEVWLEPTPGHSPGHHSVVISSRGERAVITGDVAHSPVQFAEPGWWSVADADRDQACATRGSFCERHAASSSLVIGTHFAGPTAGRLIPLDGAWRLGPSPV